MFLTDFATLGFESQRFMQASAYRRTWTIAHRLALASSTPYDFTQRVQAYLQRGFTYNESPPLRAVPLEAFVARDRAGYCQQFSGAMALMLRMGGVPARAASGFTTGQRGSNGDYEVKDTDAHSWVEAYFPGIGWVPFDPTPAAAPAAAGARARSTRDARADPGRPRGPRRARARRQLRRRGAGRGRLGPSAAAIAGWCVLGLLAASVAAGLALRLRRRVVPADPWLAEFERALRRSGPAAGAGHDAGAARARAWARRARVRRRAAGGAVRGGGDGPVGVGSRGAAARARARPRARRPGEKPVGVAAVAGRLTRRPPPVGRLWSPLHTLATLGIWNTPTRLYRRGTALLDAGDYHAAAVSLAQARDSDPDKTSIREALGRALFHCHSYGDAASEFQAVVDFAPTNDFALFCLGRCLQLLGRHAEARHPLTLAACMRPERGDYRLYRDRARAAAAA